MDKRYGVRVYVSLLNLPHEIFEDSARLSLTPRSGIDVTQEPRSWGSRKIAQPPATASTPAFPLLRYARLLSRDFWFAPSTGVIAIISHKPTCRYQSRDDGTASLPHCTAHNSALESVAPLGIALTLVT